MINFYFCYLLFNGKQIHLNSTNLKNRRTELSPQSIEHKKRLLYINSKYQLIVNNSTDI